MDGYQECQQRSLLTNGYNCALDDPFNHVYCNYELWYDGGGYK
jgi:hypothetical protein